MKEFLTNDYGCALGIILVLLAVILYIRDQIAQSREAERMQNELLDAKERTEREYREKWKAILRAEQAEDALKHPNGKRVLVINRR